MSDSEVDELLFEVEEFPAIKKRFDQRLRDNGMGNGYISLCPDFKVMIECAVTPTNLRVISYLAEKAKNESNYK